MTHRLIVALAAALVTLPFAAVAGQEILGVPHFTCQSPAEWAVHDYGAPATGSLVFLPQDGYFEEFGNTYDLFLFSEEHCVLLTENGVSGPGYDLACSTDRPLDWNGDMEFAFGGAYLVPVTGDGVTDGGLACYDTVGHYPQGATVYIDDLPAACEASAVGVEPSVRALHDPAAFVAA